MFDMVQHDIFPKATVRMDVKPYKVKDNVKLDEVKVDVKPGVRLVVVEVDVRESNATKLT